MYFDNNEFCWYAVASINDRDDFESGFDNLQAGDITINAASNSAFVYTGQDWRLLQEVDSCAYHEAPRELLPQICKCCGAPLQNHKCNYCGVEYA